MPIGNPVTLTSNVASKTISVTATASQTLFNVTGGYRINSLGVFKNGLRLQDGVDYTARDGLTVTLLSAASGGDKLQFVVFDTFRVAEAIRPNVDDQTIRGNLRVVGILSASTLEGLSNFNLTSGITTFNDVRVGGALTVAGALTFEDVTNIDSVGIITAQSHVSIADSILHTGDTDTSIRFPAAGTFTVENNGSESFRIDSSGNVGIGTDTIEANANYNTLQISGTKDTTGGGIVRLKTGDLSAKTMLFCDTGGFEARVETNHPFVVSTNGSNERLRITSAGNVGIATADPAQKLHIFGNSATTALSIGDNGLIEPYVLLQANASDNVSTLHSRGNHPLTFEIQQSEKVRITNGGNVGIGTDDPNRLLHLHGDSSPAVLVTGTAPQVRLNSLAADSSDNDRAIFGLATANGQFYSTTSAGDAVLRTTDASSLIFGEGTTERARIDASGRLLKSGQATLSSTSLNHPIQVAAASDANAILILGRASDDIGELSYYDHLLSNRR
jgi:hypothetical protein